MILEKYSPNFILIIFEYNNTYKQNLNFEVPDKVETKKQVSKGKKKRAQMKSKKKL